MPTTSSTTLSGTSWPKQFQKCPQQHHRLLSLALLGRNSFKNAHNNIIDYFLWLPFTACCRNLKSVLRIHGRLVVLGINRNISALIHLINAYSSFQKYETSSLIFNSVVNPCVTLHNTMFRAYTRSNQHEKALNLYHDMLNRGITPDKYTYTFVLKACAWKLDFEEGVKVHNDVIRRNLEFDLFISTGLVDMYCKLGQVRFAQEVFDKMPEKDIVSWNAMIGGLSRGSDPNNALEIFRGMQLRGLVPNSVSLLNLFPALCKLENVKLSRSVHGFVMKRDFRLEVFNGLIDMYSKCGFVEDARCLFDRMCSRDHVSWGTMMAGYAHNGFFHEVLWLFDEMKSENMIINNVSVVSSALAASELINIEKGKEIHNWAMQHGIDSDTVVATALMTMYVKCGDLGKAKKLFCGLRKKDLVAWSALIAAYAQSGFPEEAISLFRQMIYGTFKPSSVTLLSVFPACIELSLWKIGKSIHCYSLKAGVDLELGVGNALISLYAKSGLFNYALTIFNIMPCKNVVTCNTLISGYAQSGQSYHAMKMFYHLKSLGLKPDTGTMVAMVSTFALSHDSDRGACIHVLIIKIGFLSDCHVMNALMDLYFKSGKLLFAEGLFNETDFPKDDVSWNSMISGYVHNKLPKQAVSVFCHMKLEGLVPTVASVVSVLPGVTLLTALRVGMMLHASTVRMGFQSNTLIGNSFIDMYAKCGQLAYSEKYFREMENKDTISWNTMLAGYAVHGKATQAVALFSQMHYDDVMIDTVSFLCVLSACRHGGMLEEGRKIFHSMSNRFHLEPKLEHYACMVDLLGRSGLFSEIVDLIDKIPMEPDAAVWGALFGACEMHSNVKLAEMVLNNLVKLEPWNPAHYIGLSKIYAQSDRWLEAKETRLKLTDVGLMKIPGQSWV